MANIGSFKKVGTDFQGEIVTLSLQAKGGRIVPEANRASDAATALDEARTLVLQARSNESLVLVARSGGSASDEGFTRQLDALQAAGGPLARAADNRAAVEPIRAAVEWALARGAGEVTVPGS